MTKKETSKKQVAEPIKIACVHCQSDEIKKNGSFLVDGIKIQKYLCKSCDKNFSAKTDHIEAREHRPELNQSILDLALSGMSAKAIAEELGCAKRTVQVKLKKYLKD
jgi:transposase-like protein